MLKYIDKEINIKDKTVIHKYIDTDNGEFIAEQVELVKGKLPIYIWRVENKNVKGKNTNITVYYDIKYKECYVVYKTLQSQCHRFGAVINNEKLNIKSFYTYEFQKSYITNENNDIENVRTIYIINDNGNITKEYHLSLNNEEPKIDYSNITKIEPETKNTKHNDIVENVVENNVVEDMVIEEDISNNTDNNIVNDNKEKVVEKNKEEDMFDNINEEDFDFMDGFEDMLGSCMP